MEKVTLYARGQGKSRASELAKEAALSAGRTVLICTPEKIERHTRKDGHTTVEHVKTLANPYRGE